MLRLGLGCLTGAYGSPWGLWGSGARAIVGGAGPPPPMTLGEGGRSSTRLDISPLLSGSVGLGLGCLTSASGSPWGLWGSGAHVDAEDGRPECVENSGRR